MKQMILSSKIKGGVLSDHFFMLWFQKEKRERIWPKEEKKNGKEKKKNIWRKEIYGPQRRKRMERKKEENIWRRKIFGPRRRKRTETEKEEHIRRNKMFREGKYLVRKREKNGEGK